MFHLCLSLFSFKCPPSSFLVSFLFVVDLIFRHIFLPLCLSSLIFLMSANTLRSLHNTFSILTIFCVFSRHIDSFLILYFLRLLILTAFPSFQSTLPFLLALFYLVFATGVLIFLGLFTSFILIGLINQFPRKVLTTFLFFQLLYCFELTLFILILYV